MALVKAAWQNGELLDHEGDVRQFLDDAVEFRNRENGLARVSVKGFEFFPIDSISNRSIAEDVLSLLPAGFDKNGLPAITYEDISYLSVDVQKDNSAGENTITQGRILGRTGPGNLDVYQDSQFAEKILGQDNPLEAITTKRERLKQTFAHEIGHHWFDQLRHRYKDKLEVVMKLLEDDFSQDKDLFNTGISSYYGTAVEVFRRHHQEGAAQRRMFLEGGAQEDLSYRINSGVSPFIMINETIAGIWEISQDPEKLARLQKELPGHFELYRCMKEEGYLESKLSVQTGNKPNTSASQ